MKKYVLLIALFWLADAAAFASVVSHPGQASARPAVDPNLARQVDQFMTADPNADPTLSKREVKKRVSAKEKLKRQLAKVKAKMAEVKRPVEDIADLLRTIGIIFIIVGAVLLVLGLILSGGAYYGGGGGLLVLGLILYLIAVYAL
jgi:hypothetical protein